MIDRTMRYSPTLTRIGRGVALALAAAVLPASALAQDESPKNDARLEGYEARVQLESADTTPLTWLLLVVLAALAMWGMFKNARRTHLD